MVLRSSIQYSGSRLQSANQMSLAGPTKARGYKTNTFFADDGAVLGADLLIDIKPKFGGKLEFQPFVFVDLSYGQARQDEGKDQEMVAAKLSNIGLGTKFNVYKKVRGNFTIANPVKTDIDSELDIEDYKSVKAYIDFQYNF